MTELAAARPAFGGAIARAAAVLRRSPIRILGAIRLEAGPDGLAVSATDLDVLYVERIDDTPRPAWVACVDGARLAGFCAALPSGGEVSLKDPDEGRLSISRGRAVARLATFNPADWPEFRRNADAASHFEVDGQQLAGGLRSVAAAVSDDASRHYLCGVSLDPEALVATDGKRLARYVWPEALPAFAAVIVPGPTVARLMALLRGFADPVQVAVARSLIVFTAPRWILTSRLMEGSYPNYRQVIPAPQREPLVADRAALLAAVERVAGVMNRGETRGVKLEAADGELRMVSAERDEAAEAEDVVPVEGPAARVSVGLQVRYLVDVLEALAPAQFVELHVVNPSEPAWLCAQNDPATGHVIMPLRV